MDQGAQIEYPVARLNSLELIVARFTSNHALADVLNSLFEFAAV